MRTIAVLFGGVACEREISIITGTLACNLLRGGKYDPLPVYLAEDGQAYTSPNFFEIGAFKRDDLLKKAKKVLLHGGKVYQMVGKSGKLKKLATLDGALNCCHGGLGEGGGVSAAIEMQGVPLASPSIAPSAICMDKSLTKQFARSFNIPVVDGIRVREADYKKRGAFLLRHMIRRLKFPVIVKPTHLGSSIGIAVCKDEEEVKAALAAAYALDDCVVIEKFLVDKKDVNCAAYSLGDEVFVSEAEEAFSSHDEVYGFEQKYIKKEQKSGGRSLMTGVLRQRIRGYTKTLYKRLNMTGVVRMDFLVQGEKVYLSEINTVPGSLAYYLFCDRLSEAKEFLEGLVDDAIARLEASKKKVIKTGILETIVK